MVGAIGSLLSPLVLPLVLPPLLAQEPFAADIRPTPWRTPEEERALLAVPDGFTVTCFVAEPAIWKPLNLAFDARGRLWCTSSTEYPYAVGADRGFVGGDCVGRDKVTLHSDRDHDGIAETASCFADDLNLPIGLLPVVDAGGHDGCIVFSVPYVWRLDDLDDDGRADRRTRLYGPFDCTRDTHGLDNAFRRGDDGWIYACHGYRNISVVKGTDGHEVRLESGNTYRFRPDGSRIELFAQGQVNPFGAAIDARGDLFTADCHTQPITLVLPGACYDSFGRPHDGLGYGPQIMRHAHGSTALCGLAIESGSAFPPEFRGDLFVGNVMSSRVHRDRLEWRGSTPAAIEQQDLVVSGDPWFRPVDLQMGPDGALYVADFYNRVIGHYEVPLDHPGRDRSSGRIWRIAPPGAASVRPVPDLRRADVEALLAAFDDPDLGVRRRALDELTDRLGTPATAARVAAELARWRQAQRAVGAGGAPPSEARGTALVFALLRLDPEGLRQALAEFPLLPRLAATRALAELPREAGEPADGEAAAAADAVVDRALRALLADPDSDPFVQRAAVQAVARRPDLKALDALVEVASRARAYDALLHHAAKIALRNTLRLPGAFTRRSMTVALPRRELVDVCLALDGEEAARYLLESVDQVEERSRLVALLEHVSGTANAADLARLVAVIEERFAGERATQLELLATVMAALERRGGDLPREVAAWATELVAKAITDESALAPAWRAAPVPGLAKSASPWCLERRASADGVVAPFLCSLPRGEKRTGSLRSPPFAAPARLACWIAGHNDETSKPPIPFNRVRVRDAESDAIVAETLPPRNDVAQRVELDLASVAGRAVVVELVDGNPYDAYAWLAVGRFEPAVVTLPDRAPAEVGEELVAACVLARRLHAAPLDRPLAALLRARGADPAARAAAATALLRLAGRPVDAALAALLDDADAPRELVEPIADAIAARDDARLDELAAQAIERCPSRQQLAVATALAATAEGARRLVAQVESGKAAAALLASPALREALIAAWPDGGAAAIDALTKGLPSDDAERQKTIAERRRSFARFGGDAARGRELFTRHCAACHSVGGVGATIGPQLDGIGSRGFERLLEDLLDPSRNVDPNFARTTLFLKGGDVRSVLVRRREPDALVVVDEQGREERLSVAAVERERPSRLSLMPGNFGELLDDAATRDLLAWLLAPR